MQWFNMTSSTYKSPVFIGLLAVMSVAIVLLMHHCILVTCCNGGERRGRRGRRLGASTARQRQRQGQDQQDPESISVDELSLSSRAQLVTKAVVCRYKKADEWGEPTCPVCLADFADGEAVRVLPECLHYFHAECIDTWLGVGKTSCPMCRTETTPTPTPSPSPAGSLHHQLSLDISLEDILVRT
uniref:Uncharacterized protein n=1 Tax=Avena sativa TaxID=4498 RepID=A0ACD5ZW03_AVESA